MSDALQDRRRDLLRFLRGIQRAGAPIETLRDDESLVRSGLIDSLAILQIVTYLELEYGLDFSGRGISPEELGTIGGILGIIEQERK